MKSVLHLFLCFIIFVMTHHTHAIAQTDPALSQMSQLEKTIFSHAFSSDTVDKRLTRLEHFVFGDTQNGTTADRLKAMTTALGPSHSASANNTTSKPAQEQLAYNSVPPAGIPTASDTTQANTDTSDPPAHYPHITTLEKQILGQTYESEGPAARLKRLELKAFGQVSETPDMSARTDALEEFAERRLKTRPFIPSRDMIAASDASDDAADAPPPEDPLASLPEPPPSTARTLSRVAWCEKHLFGKTFPDMHLLQRLHQLHSELNPNEKVKDIQLMDRLDSIVKEVVLKQHPAHPDDAQNKTH